MTTWYTSEHEWIRVEGDVGTVGITAFAAEKLGDVVFVELPDAGKKVKKEGDMAVVESVKAASDVYAPVSGDVLEANAAIVDDPAKVNADPEGDGWFVKLKLLERGRAVGPDGQGRLYEVLREPVMHAPVHFRMDDQAELAAFIRRPSLRHVGRFEREWTTGGAYPDDPQPRRVGNARVAGGPCRPQQSVGDHHREIGAGTGDL